MTPQAAGSSRCLPRPGSWGSAPPRSGRGRPPGGCPTCAPPAVTGASSSMSSCAGSPSAAARRRRRRTGPRNWCRRASRRCPSIARALAERPTTSWPRSSASSTSGAPAAARPALRPRDARVVEDVGTFAEALEAGDLAACFRDAEWEGFRHGASGQAGRRPGGRGAGPSPRRRPRARTRLRGPAAERRTVERSLDRMAVRVAAGYADGVRCRLPVAEERGGEAARDGGQAADARRAPTAHGSRCRRRPGPSG